jgi:hypothetical protein
VRDDAEWDKKVRGGDLFDGDAAAGSRAGCRRYVMAHARFNTSTVRGNLTQGNFSFHGELRQASAMASETGSLLRCCPVARSSPLHRPGWAELVARGHLGPFRMSWAELVARGHLGPAHPWNGRVSADGPWQSRHDEIFDVLASKVLITLYTFWFFI